MRVPLTVMVHPASLELIRGLAAAIQTSQGKVVDRAVFLLGTAELAENTKETAAIQRLAKFVLQEEESAIQRKRENERRNQGR